MTRRTRRSAPPNSHPVVDVRASCALLSMTALARLEIPAIYNTHTDMQCVGRLVAVTSCAVGT
eukprot:scaffold134281_cov32-Tisochrysis_lutea.AAC.1